MDGITPERLGNLHLVFLHLPIGFVVAVVLLEWWRWKRSSVDGAWLQGRLLAANAVAALLTAGLGLVLATTGTYAPETLLLHRWAGVACAGLAIAAWLAHIHGGQWLARGALAVLLTATVVAGHLGATLTHGAGVTAWWTVSAKVPSKPVASAEVSMSGRLYVQAVEPILNRSCVKCHGLEKMKGGLRLDSREAALKGGKSGKAAITPGNPEDSELLRRVKLPRDDDEAMPSGDGPALTSAEIATLEKWIASGAEWR